MKNLKIVLASLIVVSSLYADEILNDTQKSILDKKQTKAEKEAGITKDSWINPLSIELKDQKTKAANNNSEIESKSASIVFDQEIFGSISKTIQKGNIELKLNTTLVDQEKKALLSRLYGYVIDLKKIDLQIEQLYYQISSKKIEIKKNEDSYIGGIIDITVLDESVIELSTLKNQRDDLNLQKLDILRDFKNYSNSDYKTIDLSFLNSFDLQKYLSENKNIKVKELEYKRSGIDKDIVANNYLPKLSVYGSYGYEDGDSYAKSDDSYYYGLKLSMPLDFNSGKNKEVSKLNKLISKENLYQTKLEEKSFYSYAIKKLKHIDNKIINTDQTIKRYKSLHENVKSLYENSLKTIDDVTIMENRMASSRLDKLIFECEKKSILNSIFIRM